MGTRPLTNSRSLGSAVALILLLGAAPGIASSAEETLAKGKYLATAGNCVSCHSNEQGQPFAGGRAFHTPFGTLYSTNITQDPETGIGNWSEQDLTRALREGVSPDGTHLYPAFPYTAYTKLSDEDIAALYAYLKTIAPVQSRAPENELKFPYNQRWSLGLWKALYLEQGAYKPDTAQSAEWNRGAYLVEALGHCGACHTPRGILGGQSAGDAMTGGEYTDRVHSGELREWSAPNLTSAANGLTTWSVEQLASYLKTGRNEFTETFGPMNEVIMNSTRHLSDEDTRAMAVYLKSLPANPGKTTAIAAEGVLSEGSSLYDVHCGTCHLPTGLGSQTEDSGARLAGSLIVQANNPASLINVIMYGPQRPEPPLPHRWKEMPAFSEKLSDDEIAAIASFVRSAWGNKAGQVTAKDVEKQR